MCGFHQENKEIGGGGDWKGVSDGMIILFFILQGILWICDGRGHQKGPMAPPLIKCL